MKSHRGRRLTFSTGLKAELQALRERELRTLPEDKSLQMLILQRHQVKKLGQLTDTLTFLRAKRSEVLEELKAEEGASSSLQSLNSALKKKLAVAEQSQASDEEGSALVSVLIDLKAKVSKVNEVDRCFKNTLKEILSKHFSVPQGRAGAENVLDESRDVDMDNLLPLKTVVGRLIEQSLNSPQNPYIEIDERFWPPHIEFLLRCQIVLKDPQNSRRIKLVPFHL